MKRPLSSIHLAVAALLMTTLISVAYSDLAGAAVLVTVTTTADTIDPDDGLISLREAVDIARAASEPTEITLAPSTTYDLTYCVGPQPPPISGHKNRSGMLEPATSHLVSIHGQGSTIHQACPARPIISNVDPGIAGPRGAIALDHVVLDGGTGQFAGAIQAVNGLTLDHVRVQNTITAGPQLGDGGAVVAGGTVSITNSVVDGNQGAAGLSLGHNTPSSTSSINNSRITNNVTMGPGPGGIFSEGDIFMIGTEVAGNKSPNHSGTPVSRSVGGVLPGRGNGELTGSDNLIKNNEGYWAGAVYGKTSLQRSTITGNRGHVVGGLVGEMSLIDVTMTGNEGGTFGGFVGQGLILRSTISGNRGAAGGAGGFDASGSMPYTSRVVRSTVENNTGSLVGGLMIDAGSGADPNTPIQAELEGSTFVGNRSSAPAGSDVANDVAFDHSFGQGSIDATGTVFGSTNDSRPACRLVGHPMGSGGYNFGADGSCGLSGTGDIVNGGDPRLEPLRVVDPEHTAVRVPGRGSPVRDRIPHGVKPLCPAGGGRDQRDVLTPQGSRCDIGASEAILGGYHPVTPRRALDTRTAHVPLGPGETRTVTLFDPPAANASAAIVNITAVNQTAASHLTAFASDSAKPATSNLNFAAGETIANQAVVPIGAGTEPGAIKVFNNSGQTDVIVDVEGYYDDGTVSPDDSTTMCPCGSALQPRNTRVLDTRNGTGGPAAKFGPGETRTLDLSALTTGTTPDAVVLNLTVTDPDAASHLTVAPAGQALPVASNLNWTAGKTIAVAATVALPSSKTLQLFNNAGHVHVIVDAYGVYNAPHGARFQVIDPVRIVDTRTGLGSAAAPLGPGESRLVNAPPGTPTVLAATFNLTGVNPSAATHLTVHTGVTVPNTSAVNIPAGGTRPNLVTGGANQFFIRNNSGQTHVLVDVAGWFQNQPVLA